MKKTIILFVILATTPAFAKNKPTITIQVLKSQASTYQRSVFIPGQRGRSETNCNTMGNATEIGSTTYGTANTNCSTTTTPGRAPGISTRTVEQEYVGAVMPDGRKVVLWCQQGFRKCSALAPGSYQAELDGNSLFVYVPELSGREHKVKYKAAMVEPAAESSAEKKP